eukprot:CAMPEP_0185020354 /NCGR_PEP_ID=MMETSP1103-20130426/2941_1 /TAXON_ID=36769 /ORGANISM="Paraphysomonas bandaiensis, Strain Caron Lab Isolate" /LENGTH=298 /DNA_ID=CAMNT_0027551189 /DNA_START=33 /DNA_END=929 /DNA_ORIENTATION=-
MSGFSSVSVSLHRAVEDCVSFLTQVIQNPTIENINYQFLILRDAHSGESLQTGVAWGTALLFLLVCIAVYTTWRGADSTNSVDIRHDYSSNKCKLVSKSEVMRMAKSTAGQTRICNFAAVKAQHILDSSAMTGASTRIPSKQSAYRNKLSNEATIKACNSGSPLSVLSGSSFNHTASVITDFDFDSSSSYSGITTESSSSRTFSREHSSHVAAESILTQSFSDPHVLTGWRIVVPRYGSGVVLGCLRKKFRSTRFQVSFDDGKTRFLKLKRGESKGVVPFTLVNTASGRAALHSSQDS